MCARENNETNRLLARPNLLATQVLVPPRNQLPEFSQEFSCNPRNLRATTSSRKTSSRSQEAIPTHRGLPSFKVPRGRAKLQASPGASQSALIDCPPWWERLITDLQMATTSLLPSSVERSSSRRHQQSAPSRSHSTRTKDPNAYGVPPRADRPTSSRHRAIGESNNNDETVSVAAQSSRRSSSRDRPHHSRTESSRSGIITTDQATVETRWPRALRMGAALRRLFLHRSQGRRGSLESQERLYLPQAEPLSWAKR